MEPLLEAIRAAVSPDATQEARAAGVGACRTILTALEASAGQPMTASPLAPQAPIANIVGLLRGVPPDQLLDLAIAKLRAALPADAVVTPVRPLKFHIIPPPLRG